MMSGTVLWHIRRTRADLTDRRIFQLDMLHNISIVHELWRTIHRHCIHDIFLSDILNSTNWMTTGGPPSSSSTSEAMKRACMPSHCRYQASYYHYQDTFFFRLCPGNSSLIFGRRSNCKLHGSHGIRSRCLRCCNGTQRLQPSHHAR